MQIICLNIHSLIIAEGGAKGPCRPAIEPSRTWQGLTLRKDASVDFAFASAVRNPIRFWPASDPASTCFSLLREINYHILVASKNIFKKHATVTRNADRAIP